MSGRKKHDHHLWEKVKASVKPIPSNRADFSKLMEQDTVSNGSYESSVSIPRIVKPVSQPEPTVKISLVPRPNVLDPAISKKIARGRIDIEGRIDLHGLNQIEAHKRLWRFLENAFLAGKRTVLVITGKGAHGEGVLRRAVPRWLQEEEFSKFASGYQESHIRHGGAGALYVRIRRNKKSVKP